MTSGHRRISVAAPLGCITSHEQKGMVKRRWRVFPIAFFFTIEAFVPLVIADHPNVGCRSALSDFLLLADQMSPTLLYSMG